ncbi:MAG: AAA family ATPase [Candidatus Pacebacteria bacterium]|nr:AAA family ATPase [Candidatus Paceibacterota bacterium]
MEINLEKNKKTLGDNKIELGDFTIFAGENNSGKTQIIDEIERQLKLNNSNSVIKISAEKVIFENEVKTGNKSDEFRTTLESLVSIAFDKGTLKIDSKVDDINERLPELFSECNVGNINLEVSKKDISGDLYLNACKEVWVKNIIDKIVIEDVLSSKKGIKLSEAGQGTERLVIVSLIRYLSEKKNSVKSDNYLIIEEPEIFLHPKLKRDFNLALRKLSNDGVKVIITTHDPYFISLNQDEKIYRVFRNNENPLTTIRLCDYDKKLKNTHHSEINYQIFDVPTFEYGLLLYYKLLDDNKNVKTGFVLENKNEVSLRDFRNQCAHPAEMLNDFDFKNTDGTSVIRPDDIKIEDNIRYFIDACISLTSQSEK